MTLPLHRLAPLALVLGAASPLAGAQEFLFTIDTGATSFSWSGSTSLGPIVPTPANFSLSGTSGLDLSSGGSPIGAGQFVGAGDALVTPDLSGEIPNPVPILPPLAVIDVTDLHFVLSSDAFTVDPAGNYALNGQATVLQGTLTFDPLVGDTVSTDLTGFVSDAAPGTGSLTSSGFQLGLSLSIDLTLSFMDPGTGVSGSVTLAGTLVGDFDCLAPANYCVGATNSTGAGAHISTNAATGIEANALVLHASGLPAGQFGIFYYGPTQVQIPFGDGFRCVGGPLVRLAPVNTGAAGTVTVPFDFTSTPPGGEVDAGDVRDFQFWYRDPAAGGAGFNFSDAIELFFCP